MNKVVVAVWLLAWVMVVVVMADAVSITSESNILTIPYTINFTPTGNAKRFINSQFCNSEPWGTWSCAKEAKINFGLENYTTKPLYLWLTFNALVTANHPQTFEFYLNGRLLRSQKVTNYSENRITLDISGLTQKENSLLIKIPDAATPKSLGINNDERLLGICLISITLSN